MSDAWEVKRDGAEVLGPYTWEQLTRLAAEGTLRKSDMVRACGTLVWARSEEAGVFGGRPAAAPPVRPRLPLPPRRGRTRDHGGGARQLGGVLLGVVGVTLAVVGLIFAAHFWMMDTTLSFTLPAAAPFGAPREERFYNVGLLEERRNGLLVSLFAVGAGAVLVAFASRRPGAAPQAPPPARPRTVAKRLAALKRLADDGHITPAEHEERRREILKEV